MANTSINERYRLKKLYEEVAVPALVKQFNYTNVNEVPKLVKIVLLVGTLLMVSQKLNKKYYQQPMIKTILMKDQYSMSI